MFSAKLAWLATPLVRMSNVPANLSGFVPGRQTVAWDVGTVTNKFLHQLPAKSPENLHSAVSIIRAMMPA